MKNFLKSPLNTITAVVLVVALAIFVSFAGIAAPHAALAPATPTYPEVQPTLNAGTSNMGSLILSGSLSAPTVSATTLSATTINTGIDVVTAGAIYSPASTLAAYTPIASYQPISVAANTVITFITAGVAGQMLTFDNLGTATVAFTDSVTDNLNLSGNLTLGQYDTLSLMYNGTYWDEITTSNN